MNKTKTFIFDLDGVIVDTAKYHFLAWQKLANELGISFTHEDNEQLKGVSRVASLELILKWGNITISQEEKEKFLIQKNEDYLAYIENIDASEILPGVEKVLKYLKENNQKIVLGSASKNARPILEKTGIIHYFNAIIDGNDVSKAKPDPEVFVLGAKNVNANPIDCIVFEDSVAGVQAANIAGMKSIGIGDKNTLHEAKFIFKDFDEISIDFIKELMVG
jgi:beta-phosphoglucomutase